MATAPQGVQDAVMEAGRMKSLLKLILTGDEGSDKVRLPIVVGLDKDDEAVVSIAKLGSPKKLRADIIKTVQKLGLTAKMKPDPSLLYFGYASVSDDAKDVLLIEVNKKPAGVGKLTVKIGRMVRSAGFSEVVFQVDEGLDGASEDDQAGAAPDAGTPAPEPAAADLLPADEAALRRELALAFGGIAAAAGADPARKAALMQLAGAANAAFKAHDARETARLIAGLKAAMGRSEPDKPGAMDPGPGTPGQVAPDKLLAMFRDAKDEVDAGLNKLQEALRATGDEDMLRIADFGLYGMTDGTGVGLMKALFDLQGAKPDARDALIAAARESATAYKTAVFADGAVDLVDGNPFGVVVGIRATLGPALDAIANAA